MGSYYYLFAITDITVQIPQEKLSQSPHLLPPPFTDHFQLLSQREFVKTSPKLPSGNQLTWPTVELHYGLSPENLLLLKPFFVDVWQTIKAYPRLPKGYNDFDNTIDAFIAHEWAKFELTATTWPNIEDLLQELPNNYFAQYSNLPQYVVVQGWPDRVSRMGDSVSLAGVTLFHAFEKIGVMPEDTVLLYNLHDYLVQKLAVKQPFIEYLYVMGF